MSLEKPDEDGYFVPTSTGDTVIRKHFCIDDRPKMLAGVPPTEHCVVADIEKLMSELGLSDVAMPRWERRPFSTGTSNLI